MSEPKKPEEVIAPNETKSDLDTETPVTPLADTAIHRKPGKKKMIIIILAALVAVGVLAAVYFLVIKDKKPVASTETAKKTAVVKTVTKEPTELEKQLDRLANPTTGETWYPTPKDLPLQGFTNNATSTENTDEYAYYEVGKHGDNTVIMGIQNSAGQFVELYEKTPAGKVTVITHPDANGSYTAQNDNTLTDRYRSDVVIDKTQHYDSLSLPSSFSLGNEENANAPTYPTLGLYLPNSSTASVKETTVKKYGGSTLFRSERQYADTGLTALSYKIKLPIGTDVSLLYTPIKEDFSAITWDDGSIVTGKFGGIVRGCGAGVSVSHGDKVTNADFVKAGSTNNGQPVYSFKDKTNALIQKAWQETKDYYDGSDAAKANISLDEFMSKHAVFAYNSKNQGWLIYTSDDYAPIGGCAKPVVYLYPSIPQEVSVRVGADVKISDPYYDPKTGWHAFAWPNGQLVVNGKTYGSLFWEGPGHGEYPGITTGTVVKRADVVATMRTQLKQQGLKQNEVDDFVDYWQTRIPNKPYVRLAWFDTAQMDELAPLTISPKPTTTIRVFLDMAGSDTDFAIPAPKFDAPARTGFTAVEWGGLARGKLY
jgi:hypothetical protein